MSLPAIAGSILVGVSLTYHAATLVAAMVWKRRSANRRLLADDALPPVSIFKPIRGVDPEHDANLESFVAIDYPAYQVIFGALDPNDPGLEAAYRLRDAYPERDIVVVAGGEVRGENRKVSTLLALQPFARHGYYVLADSDMRVSRGYLRRVMSELLEPNAGLVTCPYRGAGPRSGAAVLEALGIGTDFMPGAFLAYHAFGVRFAFGSTIAVSRDLLSAIGGFEGIADLLADDFALADRTRRAGHDVVLSGHVVDTTLGAEAFGSVWRRRVRWAKTSRALSPGPYYGMGIAYLTPLALLSVALSGFTGTAWGVFAGAVGIRIAIAFGVARFTRDAAVIRWLPLLPVSELVCATIWLLSLVDRKIHWRGEVFEIRKDGSLQTFRK